MEQKCMQLGNKAAIKWGNLENALDYYYHYTTIGSLITDYVANYINNTV